MNARVIPIDPLLAANPDHESRVVSNRKLIAKFNGDQERIERLMRSQPGHTARRFFEDLSRVNIGARTTGEIPHVIVHPRSEARLAHPSAAPYDQTQDGRSRIPEAIQLPLSLLLANVDAPGTVSAAALLAAVASIREFQHDDCPVFGLPRPGGVA